MSLLRAYCAVLALMVMCCSEALARECSFEYLSDIPDRMSWTQQWGELGFDTASYALGQSPQPVTISGKRYAKGLGTIAGRIVVDLAGVYDRFDAEVGMQTGAGAPASAVFQVFVDGRKRFDSGVMRIDEPARKVSVRLSGADELELVVTDAGDGIVCDQANWADARLTGSQSAAAHPAPRLDIGRFARVVTWDPHRIDGARCNRAQEFPGGDLFLETDVLPSQEGVYTVPAAQDGLGCIGLQWPERRRLCELRASFPEGSPLPSHDGVRVEYWAEDRGSGSPGASVWQGHWAPIKGDIRQDGHGWVLVPDWGRDPDTLRGVWKVRWVFPASAGRVGIRRLSALSVSRSQTADLVLELEKPLSGLWGDVRIYNGEIASKDSPVNCRWDLSKRLSLKVRYMRTRLRMADRTVIRLALPGGGFGIAVDDVLRNGCVYVKDFGVFATRSSAAVSLADYKKRIAGRRTVLQEVRQSPDQTFEQASAKVHQSVQDMGPMLISLAGDDRKIHVDRDGTVHFRTDAEPAIPTGQSIYPCMLSPRFGSGKNEGYSRSLYGGWLPVPVITLRDCGITYRQRTFVTPFRKEYTSWQASPWLATRPLAVVEFTAENPGSAPARASLDLTISADSDKGVPAEIARTAQGCIAHMGERLLVSVDTSDAPGAGVTVRSGVLTLSGSIPAGSSIRCYAYIPLWDIRSDEHASLKGAGNLLKNVEVYWQRVMSPAMQLDIPDAKLKNLILASQVHCMISTRSEDDGARLAMWDGSICYGPLAGDSNYGILGLDLMGHHDFAQRCLDFFIRRYNPEGFLTTGYTIMGTGWHLWILAQHFGLTADASWMRQNAAEISRVCRWIAAQTDKTRRSDARGEKMPEYGLMPPGVEADWNTFAYYFCLNGYFYSGLDGVGRVLDSLGYPEAAGFRASAAELKSSILRAYHRTQALAPVLPLRDGTWVPEYPSQVYCPAPTADLYPGEDSGRTWCYDVEEGAPHLIAQGVVAPNSHDADWMVNHLEDVQFLADGWLFYPASQSHQDPFNLGGFSKVQPYLTRTAQIYALRDEVKPFIRSYFNAVASVMNMETLSCSEHFAGTGAPTNSESMGHFLEQTRWMLLMERGQDLWLAPFVTSNWLKDGMTVGVTNAPSYFGRVGYRVSSHVAQGCIEATIDPPTRSTPKSIVLRLRHPEGKQMKSVVVNGQPWADFDAEKEIVRLRPGTGVGHCLV